jgi:5-methylcytosine-specific restriction endonuclease McrA
MARIVAEWIGKTDDTAIPDRVKERIARKYGDQCAHCKGPIGGRSSARFDHIIPLILGGQNREDNLQLLCGPCHQAKTNLDVKLKAKVFRVRRKHLGIKKPSKFPCSRDSKWKKKIDGSVVLR